MKFTYKGVDIEYREGTSDTTIIKEVLIDRTAYALPTTAPKCILDIGANIGITTILMATEWPEAKIYCFEPDEDNFALLAKNTSTLKNVECINCAVSDYSGYACLFASDDPVNLGGFSLESDIGIDIGRAKAVTAERLQDFLDERALAPDFVKIDCEGHEYRILKDTSLASVKWIMGEAHGIDDFKLFDHLREEGYDLSIFKGMDQRTYPFYARRMAKKND